MSNPTPILNNINAFDATKGTTISFNIIGGTDIVRSNIVYIYDLSTNDLICTHLYISTESIHELPPNTDPSIVYASGKSSADFVNNKNYYLQIQTFTNTAGTAGGSGMSVAKTFWCLFNPALSVNAIPAAISTTSYNVGATYNTNVTDTSIPVTNIIQQYKFDLYTATGTLVQTSGNIIGSGEQEGTSTTYNITYNFSGLVVNSSYYVVVTTTSTEGMTVSAQSNTFTVSIETPTVGAATATNNSCDGYISVVSNLSSEYGGNVSGEIASFETDSVNNVSSLKVNMEPIQDLHGYDHPWVGGAGKNLWSGSNGFWSASNGEWSTSGNAINYQSSQKIKVSEGDVFYIESDMAMQQRWVISWLNGTFVNSRQHLNAEIRPYTVPAGVDEIAIDLDFGSQALAKEAKVMMNRGSTAEPFEPYSNICPISGWDSVEASVAGKNLVNWTITEHSFDDNYNGFGQGKWQDRMSIPSSWHGKTLTYSARIDAGTSDNQAVKVWFYKNGTYLPPFQIGSRIGAGESGISSITITVPSSEEANQIAFGLGVGGGSVVSNPQVEVGSTATAYEPYQGQTYTTDLNQTVYGGTVDMATGVLTVTHGYQSFNGSETGWGEYHSGYGGFRCPMIDDANIDGIPSHQLLSNQFVGANRRGADDLVTPCLIKTYSGNTGADTKLLFFCNTGFTTLADFRAHFTNNPITLSYPLAEPQTYQLTPHQIQTLVGQNNIWSDAGDVEVTFNLPITNLLVKRQDTSDTSGKWLTLYSQPITQASDMDFTYIDFLNQHGKTYRYALVPLLTQQQGDVDVEIEGGYTVSDDVLSVFDGVFIANSNGSQKLKAATEYGDLETNQDVGVLTTIGNKYPFVVSNSNLNYHSGSISALIVPSDFYTSGDLDRLDIVERREAIEQFLTDKTAKILKDWNGNIWLITFVENVEVSFVDDYGMGLGALSAKWVEIGDVNDQTDLQQTGLI